MKNRIRISFAVLLISIFIACSLEQIKKMGDILPNVLLNVTHAYGSPYSTLIGNFFKLITGTDHKNDDVTDPQEEGSADQTEGVYYSSDETENYSQDQEYSEDQPQQEQEYYDGTSPPTSALTSMAVHYSWASDAAL